MEKFSEGLRSLVKGQSSGSGYLSTSEFSSDRAQIVVRKASRTVSLWTCSKFCAISFAVGVVIGFTLKGRLRRWAAKMLKRIKDDY